MGSPMFEAFMDNQKFTDKEASDIEMSKQRLHQEYISKAYQQLDSSQNISDYVDIGGEITREEIEQTTESHPHFNGYDHSLEMPRISRDGYFSEGVNIPEPEPESFRLLPRGIPNIIDNPDSDEVVDYNEIPDFGINWDSVGNQLGL